MPCPPLLALSTTFKFSPLPGSVRLPLTLIRLPLPGEELPGVPSTKVKFEPEARFRVPVESVPMVVALPGTRVLPETVVRGPWSVPAPLSVCVAERVRPAPLLSAVVSSVAPEATLMEGELAMLLAEALLSASVPPLTVVPPP